MVVEIGAGWYFNSMALMADGWHMSSHSLALSITVFAYWYARRHLLDNRFTFGTGKIGVLGGFTSAILLGVVALLMVWESTQRFFEPLVINFNEAIAVAFLGLVVNLVSVKLLHLKDHHHDHNHKAAFLHVLADTLTSVLAIIALFSGKIFGWVWMDPMMGIVGAMVIGHWTYGLLRDTGRVLLDFNADDNSAEAIKQTIEADADNRVTDLHVWWVGPYHLAAIASIVTHYPQSTEHYKALLKDHHKLVHITVEVHHCESEPCVPVVE